MQCYNARILKSLFHLFFIAVFACCIFSSCSKNNGGIADVYFSKDTIFFDTVFTEMATVTKRFTIRNTTNEDVVLNNVQVAGGENSIFKLNINGFSGQTLQNIEVFANDSVFVFVKAMLNKNHAKNKLIQEDSILFDINGNTKKVILAATGQDARYYFPTDTTPEGVPYSTLSGNVTWNNELPIVIVNFLIVPAGSKLTILPGTQVHLYRNGLLYVDKNATIEVLGELDNPVVFQGTRLESNYQNNPGQWQSIRLFENSSEHIFRNAIIKNGYVGLECYNLALTQGSFSPSKLVLENVRIQNMSAMGIFTVGYNFDAYNLHISNTGQYCAAITGGGDVNFYHTTMANFWSGNKRQTPTFFVNNYFVNQSANTLYGNDLNCHLFNSIIYGAENNEFAFDSTDIVPLNFSFNNCMMKLDKNFDIENNPRFVNIIKNPTKPGFVSPALQNYQLTEDSEALDKGERSVVMNNNAKLLFDLQGKNRLTKQSPDLGAYSR